MQSCVESVVTLGKMSCHNPLQPHINIWIRGTENWLCIVGWVHVVCVSKVIIFVSVMLKRIFFFQMTVHLESNSNIRSMSYSGSFHLLAIVMLHLELMTFFTKQIWLCDWLSGVPNINNFLLRKIAECKKDINTNRRKQH